MREPRSASRAGIVARNSLYGLLALGVDKAVFMAIVLVLARYLGTANFGRFAFVVTYLTVFQFVADLGVEMILVRRISERPEDRARLLANGFALRLVWGTACWGLAVALVRLLAGEEYVPLTAVAGISVVTNTWLTYRALYRSVLRIEYLLALMSCNALVTAAGVGLVVLARGGVLASVSTVALGSAVTLPVAVWLGSRFFRFRLAADLRLWRELLVEALPLGVNTILLNLSLRIGPILLVRLAGPEEVGYFAAASKLVEAMVLLPEVPMLTIFPIMASLGSRGPKELVRVTRTATKWVATSMLLLALLVATASPVVIRLLYGEAFAPAAATLSVLAWVAAFAGTGVVWIGLLTTLGLQKFSMIFYGVATALHVALGIPLVRAHGALGAASAALAAAAFSQGLFLFLPSARAYVRPAARAVLPAFVAAALLAGAAFAVELPALVETAGGLVLFLAASVAAGVLGSTELTLARGLFTGRTQIGATDT